MPEERTRRKRGKIAARLNRYSDVRAGNVSIRLETSKAEPGKTSRRLGVSEKKKGGRSKKGQGYTVGIPIVVRNTLDERLEWAVDIESRAEVVLGLCRPPRLTAETRLDAFRRGYPTHILKAGTKYVLGVPLFSEVGNAEPSTHGSRTIRCPLSIGAKSQGVDAK